MQNFSICYFTLVLLFSYSFQAIISQFIENDEKDALPLFYDDNLFDTDVTNETSTNQNDLKIWPNSLTIRSHKKKRSKLCNNDDLQRIMKENIQDNPRTSKRAIYHAAFEELQVGLNVICARCMFSFLTKTTLYCQEAVKNITCYAYKS